MILLKYTDEGFMDGALTVAAPFLVGSSLILLGIRLLLLRFYPDADYTYYPRTMDSHPASEMSVPDLMDEDGMPIPKCPPPISKGGLNPFDWLLAARSITDRQILARHGLEAMMFVYISRRIAQCGTLMGALAIPLICVNGIHDQYLQDAADSDAEYFTGWPQWTIINLPKADPFTFLHSFCFAIVSTALIYASWDSLQILLTNRIIFRRSRKAYSTLDAHTVLISNLPRNLTQPSVLAYHIETAYQPDSVLAAEIVFEVPDLVKLCHKRQQVSRDLRHATNYLNVKEVRPTGKVNEHEGVCTFFRGFMDEKVDLINHYTRQDRLLRKQISNMRRERRPSSGHAFVVLANHSIAKRLVQNFNSKRKKTRILLHPEYDDRMMRNEWGGDGESSSEDNSDEDGEGKGYYTNLSSRKRKKRKNMKSSSNTTSSSTNKGSFDNGNNSGTKKHRNNKKKHTTIDVREEDDEEESESDHDRARKRNNIGHRTMKGTYWEICTAPPPEDIDWSSFFQPDEGRILRRVMIELTNFALMFAYSVPVGLLCSITYLVDLPALGDFFELLMDMPIEMVTMINSTIPAGVIFFFATFTPMMQRKFAQQIGFKTSSAITVYACRMLMLFDFVSIILGPAMLIGICSGGQDFVKRIDENITSELLRLGLEVTTPKLTGVFMVAALAFGVAMPTISVARPIQFSLRLTKKLLAGKDPISLKEADEVEPFSYDTHYARSILVLTIGLFFFTSTPVIAPFCAFGLWYLYYTNLYLITHVHPNMSANNLDGQMAGSVLQNLLASISVCCASSGTSLLAMGGYGQVFLPVIVFNIAGSIFAKVVLDIDKVVSEDVWIPDRTTSQPGLTLDKLKQLPEFYKQPGFRATDGGNTDTKRLKKWPIDRATGRRLKLKKTQLTRLLEVQARSEMSVMLGKARRALLRETGSKGNEMELEQVNALRGKDNWNPSDTELKELENMNEMSKSKSRTHTRTSHMYSVNSRGFSAHDDIMDDDMMDDYISPGGLMLSWNALGREEVSAPGTLSINRLNTDEQEVYKLYTNAGATHTPSRHTGKSSHTPNHGRNRDGDGDGDGDGDSGGDSGTGGTDGMVKTPLSSDSPILKQKALKTKAKSRSSNNANKNKKDNSNTGGDRNSVGEDSASDSKARKVYSKARRQDSRMKTRVSTDTSGDTRAKNGGSSAGDKNTERSRSAKTRQKESRDGGGGSGGKQSSTPQQRRKIQGRGKSQGKRKNDR